jgi:serine protease Do
VNLRPAPAWTAVVIGLLFGALAGSLLVIWRDRNEPTWWRSAEEPATLSVAEEVGAGAEPAAVASGETGGETPTDRAAATATTSALSGDRRNAIVRATERVAPAVVSINVLAQQTVRGPTAEFWDRFFPGFERQRGYYRNVQNFGSGVIVSADGYVVTNAHVVAAALQIVVTLSDGRQFPARLLDTVERYDLALLQIEGSDLPVAPLAQSENLHIGEWAIAIGSPFGYLLADTQPTVTVGVISALNRDIKPQDRDPERIYLGMIQTDAAINPGNSGGPLVNTAGEVIGINSFIFTEGGGSVGIGFAVPIARARWVIEEVREFGRYREANLGFTLRVLSPGLVAYLGIEDPVGFLVVQVRPESAAAKAGIRAGDVLREIDGVKLQDRDTVTRLVYEAMVGDRLAYRAERDGQPFSGTIVLEERP